MSDLDELAQAAAGGEPPPRRTYETRKRADDETKLWAFVVAGAVGLIAIIAIIVALNQQPVENTHMRHPDEGVGGPTFFGIGGDKK